MTTARKHASPSRIGVRSAGVGGHRLRALTQRLDRDGFTLVELLVVMMILVIGILPLAMVQSRARLEVSESDRYTQAITVAQDQLERMRGLGFGNAAPDSGLAGPITWRSNVALVSQGLERLEITVLWTEPDGDRTLTVADLVSQR
jgi:prepilin-type N-terminal cleavage/methylation domain-containing protein